MDMGEYRDDNINYTVKILRNSIKYYLPRVEGYLEVIRRLSSEYSGMSLIEFDGYFEKKFEPVKYVRVEVHMGEVDEGKIIEFANDIRNTLKQKSLAIEFNNQLILVEEKWQSTKLEGKIDLNQDQIKHYVLFSDTVLYE
jgi:hypothetical protein